MTMAKTSSSRSKPLRHSLLLSMPLLATLTVSTTALATPNAKPWRLQSALGAPLWLHLSLQHRMRFEALGEQFRRGQGGSEQGLALRTLVAMELRWNIPRATTEPKARLSLGLELADSRFHFADDDALLDTGLINPLDLLQLYVALRRTDLIEAGSVFEVRLGRQTLDIGGRRLSARNGYRNTINTFTGLHLRWRSPSWGVLRAFAVFPVTRQPTNADGLADHELHLDEERTSAVFWGAHVGTRGGALPWRLRGELYLLGIHEGDSEDSPSRNRALYTPGARLYRSPARGDVDLELEGMVQLGRSRASSAPTDTRDLDHLAFFAHIGVGYTLSAPWRPRLGLSYDHASGDSDPDDGKSGRFDTLFGARRFAYGPTGIWGLLARGNLRSPEAKLSFHPWRELTVMLAYRLAWLAEARDSWTTAGLRDRSGDTGSFLGQQLEGKVCWHLLPGNLHLEVGFAAAWLGDVAELPGLGSDGSSLRDPAYGYTQLTLML